VARSTARKDAYGWGKSVLHAREHEGHRRIRQINVVDQQIAFAEPFSPIVTTSG